MKYLLVLFVRVEVAGYTCASCLDLFLLIRFQNSTLGNRLSVEKFSFGALRTLMLVYTYCVLLYITN